ncbi:MAG TPA: SPOR domain-containing protein [Luteimonas sp.]|nr:SPOR domain-containing protein [Luteimonas sp.]
MAARRSKTQARRNHGNSAGLPGWAWLVLGVVLTIGVVLVAPKYIKSGDGDGFLRPRPNPDAQPAATAGGEDDDAIVADNAAGKADDKTAADAAKPKQTQYDFYTLLPGEEVAMSDAELAATAREEAARQASVQSHPAAQANTTAAAPVTTAATATTPASNTPAAAVASTPKPGNDAHYILQAGAFGASGDAEAVKAKIALLGLSARVESAAINGKTVYRVRMGPYGTAIELAEAKRKLGNGGLPALAIKAK